jgi:putative SOS response-associated peptidase YedK
MNSIPSTIAQMHVEGSIPTHLPVDLLRPFPAEAMEAWKVIKAVGNVKNNEPSLVLPI